MVEAQLLKSQISRSSRITLGTFTILVSAFVTICVRNERAIIAGVVGSAMVLKSSIPYSLQGIYPLRCC